MFLYSWHYEFYILIRHNDSHEYGSSGFCQVQGQCNLLQTHTCFNTWGAFIDMLIIFRQVNFGHLISLDISTGNLFKNRPRASMSEYKQLPINLRLFQNTVKLLDNFFSPKKQKSENEKNSPR